MGILELAAGLTAAAVASGIIEIIRKRPKSTQKHTITIKVDQGAPVTLNEFEGSWDDFRRLERKVADEVESQAS